MFFYVLWDVGKDLFAQTKVLTHLSFPKINYALCFN